MWHKNNETLFHSHKFKSKLQGLKSVLHCNGGTCIRVTLRVMACILVSQRLPFLMSLCNLDVPLWSARMLAVSNSFQRDKRCQILSQCSAHGLLSLPHQLLQRLKKKDILTVYHIYTLLFKILIVWVLWYILKSLKFWFSVCLLQSKRSKPIYKILIHLYIYRVIETWYWVKSL